MTTNVQSAFIGALVTIAIVAGMLLRQRRRRIDLLFAIFAANIVLWFLGSFLHNIAGPSWTRAEMATASLVPASLLVLHNEILGTQNQATRSLTRWVYPVAILALIVSASPLGELTAIQIATVIYIGVTILLIARVIIRSSHSGSGTVENIRIKYLAFGSVAAVFLTILGRVPWFGPTSAALGDLAVMFYVFFLSQVILRDRLLDLHEFFGRIVVLGVIGLMFAAISGILIVALPNNAAGRLFNTLISIIILLTLYEPLKDRLQAKSMELFFRERYELGQLLVTLRRAMLRVLDPGRMSTLILDTLYDERRCTHAAIYLLEQPLGRGLRLEAYRGPEPANRVSERHFPALWHSIHQNRGPLLAEQIISLSEDNADVESNRDLIDAMRAVSADVLLPFLSGTRVMGFLALRDDRVPEPYSTEEIALLMNIADTAVTVIENSQLTQKLLERDRLATIGEMAAGLAHEIRNPLGAIKGAAEYLEPESFEDRESADFLQVIIDESNRLNGVVTQFLDYARPFRANFAPTDINNVVQKTVKLIAAKEETQNYEIDLRLDENAVEVSADGEQIKQVLLNLILNAVEATSEVDRPIVVKTRYVAERERLEIRVRDYGEGIHSEALAHIFIPFFTTKSKGTGLGLAVCQRIVNNHGGDIRAQSTVGNGTEFIIRLPLQQRSDNLSTGTFSNPIRERATEEDSLSDIESEKEWSNRPKSDAGINVPRDRFDTFG